MNQKWN